MSTAEAIVIGGGVMGSSVAFHLRERGLGGRIVVIERDPSYERASSRLAMGGIRQQFESPVNVALVRRSLETWRAFDERFRAEGAPRADFRPRGYLFLADTETAPALTRRFTRMEMAGARVERLDPTSVATRWPGLVTDDLCVAVFGADDGYANPGAVLAGLRAAAVVRGVEYVAETVSAIEVREGAACGVRLAGGERIDSPRVVLAAGAWSAPLVRTAGITLPVEPQRQQLFRVALPEPWPYRFPMVVDPTGVHWRHEDDDRGATRDTIIVARTHHEEPFGERFELDASRWSEAYRPALVHRAPGLAQGEMVEGWAGLYEVTPDHQPLLGVHPACAGLFVAAGFSGHGLMMSPAVGEVIASLVLTGRSEPDVSCFAPDRFERHAAIEDGATI